MTLTEQAQDIAMAWDMIKIVGVFPAFGLLAMAIGWLANKL